MTEQEREEMERLQLEELRFNQKVREIQKKKAKYIGKPLIILTIILAILVFLPLFFIVIMTIIGGLGIHFQSLM